MERNSKQKYKKYRCDQTWIAASNIAGYGYCDSVKLLNTKRSCSVISNPSLLLWRPGNNGWNVNYFFAGCIMKVFEEVKIPVWMSCLWNNKCRTVKCRIWVQAAHEVCISSLRCMFCILCSSWQLHLLQCFTYHLAVFIPNLRTQKSLYKLRLH